MEDQIASKGWCGVPSEEKWKELGLDILDKLDELIMTENYHLAAIRRLRESMTALPSSIGYSEILPANNDPNSGEGRYVTVIDQIVREEEMLEMVREEQRQIMEVLEDSLKDGEVVVIKYRHVLRMTFQDIGTRLYCSRTSASREYWRVVKKLGRKQCI